MRRSTRSGREYGAGPATELSPGEVSGGPGVDRREVTPKRAGQKIPSTGSTQTAPPKQRPLLRGWVTIMAVPYSVALAYHLVFYAPTLGSAKAAIVSCFCCAVGYAISSYYHAVTHTPAWRAFVRKFDHASIFLTIAGSYTPFVYRAYEITGQSWMLAVLVAEWMIALTGMANSIGGLVPNMSKLHRAFMYIAVAWIPIPVAGFALDWDVCRWVSLGGLVYMSGGVMYATQWPDPMPGVFGYHELMHLSNIVANTLMLRGLLHAFLQN